MHPCGQLSNEASYMCSRRTRSTMTAKQNLRVFVAVDLYMIRSHSERAMLYVNVGVLGNAGDGVRVLETPEYSRAVNQALGTMPPRLSAGKTL